MSKIEQWLKVAKDHENDFILYFLRVPEILVKVEFTEKEMIIHSKFEGNETVGKSHIPINEWLAFYNEIEKNGFCYEIEKLKRKLEDYEG